MTNLTREQIIEMAEAIRVDVCAKIHDFLEQTGCVFTEIIIKTTKKTLGQTGLANITQQVGITVKPPQEIPEEVPHADD